MTPDTTIHDESSLRQRLQNDPSDWDARRELAHALYDRESFAEAADLIWSADQIPSNDIDLAFSARILAKAQPRKAIRLLTALLEHNRGKAVQNMAMANALLHHGMVLQAARFYGAAIEADSSFANPDLEHFLVWTDDEMTLWGDFKNRRPALGDLPWMARNPQQALELTSQISLHTTPIALPKLSQVPGENILHELYEQEARKNAPISPPPAVTIPIDRVDPKYRRYDETYGAATTPGSEPAVIVPAATPTSPAPAVAVPPAASLIPSTSLHAKASAPAPTVAPPVIAAPPVVAAPPPVVVAPPPMASPVPTAPLVVPTRPVLPGGTQPAPVAPPKLPGGATAPTPTGTILPPPTQPAPTQSGWSALPASPTVMLKKKTEPAPGVQQPPKA